MKQIRKNVFETNSSSTHTLAICTEDEYKDWQDGKLLFINGMKPLLKIPLKLIGKIRKKQKKIIPDTKENITRIGLNLQIQKEKSIFINMLHPSANRKKVFLSKRMV